MEIEKYIDNKLVQILNITEMEEISISGNNVYLKLVDSRLITFEFEDNEFARQGLQLINQKIKEEKWQEEFIGSFQYTLGDGLELSIYKKTFGRLIREYFGYDVMPKLKVKCKDGMIQIERID